jgi:serine/threonine protein kinase/tetratricopeptide (TPR) repeat protein
MIGEALGHYRIIKKIGSGGMGEVYRARDDKLDRDIALKTLPTGTLADEATRKRFRQEALILAKLNHPNIATIHEFGSQDGVDFLVMELISGKSLKEILSQGPLAEKQIQRLGLQLADGLEAAHQHGVVHRDLKPANIMITSDGRLKILDFGLAKLVQDTFPEMAQSSTKGDAVPGTMPYMAPEQLKGAPVDGRTDIYAAGAVLYEMATGQRPFLVSNSARLLDSILHKMPRPPCELNQRLSSGMQIIILKALEKLPEDRHHSIHELRLEVERLTTTTGATHPALETVNASREQDVVDEKRQAAPPSVSVSSRSEKHEPKILVATPAPQSSARTHTVQITVPEVPQWAWLSLAGCILISGVLTLSIPAVRDSVFHIFSHPNKPPPGIPSLEEGKHVIVLPFDVQGNRDTLGYVAEGLDEELSRKLSAMPVLHVVSASAVKEQAKHQKVDLNGPADNIGRNFGVNLIVHGTVQEGGGWIRINVNFDDVPDARPLLAEPFSYPAAAMNLLDLEDQVYKSIVRELKLRPSSQEQIRAANPTSNNDAYDHYLQGRYALSRQSNTEGINTAIGFYERAIQEDPRFTLAYVRLSDSYRAMYGRTSDPSWFRRALESAEHAQKLNDDLPEVHLALGDVYRQLGETKVAVTEFGRAKQLSPNSDLPWLRLGITYEESGQRDQAVDAYLKATQLNPYSLVDRNELGYAYFRHNEYEKALVQFRSVTDLDPANYYGYMNTGAVHLAQGKYDESIQELERALDVAPSDDDPAIHSDIGSAYFYLKRYTDSVKENEKAVKISPNDYTIVGNLADAYRWSKRRKKAAETYTTAIDLATRQLDLNSRNTDALGSLALFYAKNGDLPRATDCIRRARLIDPSNSELIFDEATVRMIAKQPSQAIESLRLALAKGYSPKLVEVDPEFSTVQSDPNFKKLVKGYSRKSN